MGDVGDDYRAWREIKSDYKQKCLDEADSKGWSKHTPYHWYRDVNGERLDYWPSTRKTMWRGRIYGSDGNNEWYLELIGETK